MNILVCISRVPDTATRISVGSDGKSIDQQNVKFIVNPYDEFAIEEALQIKEKNGGEVSAVTIGSEIAKDVLRTSYAMGVDKAILVKSEEQPTDSFFVANNLAEVAKQLNPDLIFLGKQSVDYDSLQVPSALGELLGLPSINVVSKLRIENGKAIAERDIEGGRETVEATLPCIISCQKGLNEPRYPKLPQIMKAKSKPISEKQPVESSNRVTVSAMEIPMKQRKGTILGSEADDIQRLVNLLHEEAKVI